MGRAGGFETDQTDAICRRLGGGSRLEEALVSRHGLASEGGNSSHPLHRLRLEMGRVGPLEAHPHSEVVVIPSIVEGSRELTLKLTIRDPSTAFGMTIRSATRQSDRVVKLPAPDRTRRRCRRPR